MAPVSAGAESFGESSGDGTLSAGVSTVLVSGGAGDPLAATGTTAITIPVPPLCWWGSFTGGADPTDAKAMEKWFTTMRNGMRGHAAAGYFALPTAEHVRKITKLDKTTPHTWYELGSQEGVNCAEEGFTTSFGTGGEAYGAEGAGAYADYAIPVSYAAFPSDAPVPPPIIDVEDVVTAVWDRATAQVEGPQLDRNPQIRSTGGSTLVNLDTWFWVQNVQEALADDGRIRLEVSIPGTPVRATLTSSTEGVQISSPAGATTCSIPAVKTEWRPGVSTESACVIPFNRANTAGWPVTAQTTWAGSWEGADRNGPTGGTLETLTPSATITVPVAESQALVTDVD